MQRQDYIERMIVQVAAAVARIMGFEASGQPEQAERELTATWSSVFGLRRSDLERLDAGTLCALLGEKRIAAAQLLEAEADWKRSRGDVEDAARLTGLAERLRS
jgi:hypothetical protein